MNPTFLKKALIRTFACGLCLWVGFLIGKESAFQNRESYTDELDFNSDGLTDAETFNERGVVVRSHHDRNFDGQWDYFDTHINGVIRDTELDDNFDGKIDGGIEYKTGNIDRSEHDLDGNGVPDIFFKYRYGLGAVAFCLPNGATNGMRVDLYKDGILAEEYRDLNEDGLLEIKLTYDRFGNEVHEETLNPAVTPEQIKWD